MQHAVFTHALAGAREREELGLARAGPTAEVATGPTQGPWSAVLGLQRSAGNAAVTRMLQGRGSPAGILVPSGGRRRSPAAPVSVSRQADDEWGESSSEWSSGGESESGAGSEWSGGESSAASGGESEQAPSAESGGGSGGGEPEQSPGAEWSGGGGPGAGWSGGGGPGAGWSGGGSGGGEEETGEDSGSWWPFDGDDESGEQAEGDEGDGEHSEGDIDRKMAEGETGSEPDEYVPTGGGTVPFAGPAAAGDGFHDGGRLGTVPFGDLAREQVDLERDGRPRVFTGGGRVGTKAWSGGGPTGGPKGNQESGSMHNTEPYYDSQGNGPFSDADAWVRDGTGIADVRRDYVASNAGDQGNGWWISPAAASALEAHEQRHVASSRSLYEAYVQPVRDRVLQSATTGKGLSYWQSDARDVLKRRIGWADAIRKFVDEDKSSNGNWGQIDTQDYGSAGYPRNMHGPRTIQGKEYESYLIMGSEPDPT